MRLAPLTLPILLPLMASCATDASHQPAPEEPRTLRVAVCQLRVSGDPEAAMRDIDRALARAAAARAEVACFPEASLFGWVNPTAHRAADPIPGATTRRLGELANRHGLMIAVGIAERAEGCLHDSAVLIDRDGTLLLRHRKVNILTELMDPPYTPGVDARASVVETRLGRIGMLVCADTFKDDLTADVAAGEPDLVIVPYGWAAPAADWPEHGKSLEAWVRHTARTVDAPVIGVDATGEIGHGPWAGFLYGGQSVVCDRHGRVLGVLADREPDLRIFELTLD